MDAVDSAVTRGTKMVAEPIDFARARRAPDADTAVAEPSSDKQPPPEQPARERVPRQVSSIEFPYYDLDSAIEIATLIHERGGTQCDTDQLAAWAGASATSSAFKMRLSAVKMYGLIVRDGSRVRLTTLGQEIVDHEREQPARVRAFLNVPLYRGVYEKFRGAKLPPAEALEREMVQLGVSPSTATRARWIFERAADNAGFFSHGTKDRLVSPVVDGAYVSVDRPARDDREREPERQQRRPSIGGPRESVRQHPFIQGLLGSLPDEEGKKWSADDRLRWFQAAARIFDLMYGPADEIHMEVRRDDQPDLYHR